MSESIAGIPPPYRGPYRPPPVDSLEIVAESFKLIRQSFSARPDIWLIAAILLTGTNIVDIVFGSPDSLLHSPLTIGSLTVRVIANIWLLVVAIRAFVGGRKVWAVDFPLLRFALTFAVLFFVVSMLLLFTVTHFVLRPLIATTVHDAHTAEIIQLVAIFLWLVGFAILTVRLSPWLAGLAIGDSAMRLSVAWKGMRGVTLAAIGALIWMTPVFLAHFALTAAAQHLNGAPQLLLTVLDGLVSVLQLMVTMAITAVLYRRVKTHPWQDADHLPA